MKKFAFSLAELLIAMGVLGVIAALTLPSFQNNNQKRIRGALLSATVSDVENALTSMIMDKQINIGVLEQGDLKPVNLTKYLNATSVTNAIYTLKNGAEVQLAPVIASRDEQTVLNAGGSLTNQISALIIDVNGSGHGRNKDGVDKFTFAVGSDGRLYPYGGLDVYILNKGTAAGYEAQTKETCSKAPKSECTAYLAENGYKIDY